jgi:uncharacterized membrane protein
VNDLGAFTDWRLVLGSHLDRATLAAICAAAGFALAVSGTALFWERRRGRALLLFALRTAGVACCLLVALQPSLELGQVTRVPNHVAVLVDTSQSMEVKPPDAQRPRFERAAAMVSDGGPLFARWQSEGHRVELYSFGEALAPATAASLRAAPKAEGTRIGETLSELRGRYAGRDLGGVVLLSDGIDTGRIGRGPLDAETRKTIDAFGVPIHTVLVGERTLRDLSVRTVLADDFAFVRIPIKLEAIIRHSGLGDRRIEVTLARNGRLVDSRSVQLRSDAPEEKVTFDYTPDHPGNLVFEIATPALAGEALTTNNRQVFTLKVIRDRVRVLHVCGRPSWDQRFLRSILRLDPNVDLVSFFILRTETDDQPWRIDDMSLIRFPQREIFAEQLRSFDLLVFHNFNHRPYGVEPYLPGVRDYIESGGALAMIGGDLSFASGDYAGSALRDVLPVDLDGIPQTGERALSTDSFRPKLTAEGRGHPLTALSLDPRSNEARWAELPPLEGINRVARLRQGATALLVHPTHKSTDRKPAPVLAVSDVGKGRTLALLTDTAWHWGFLAAGAGDDGRAFQRFWDGAIRWLVRDPALTLLRIDLDRLEYRRGQTVIARARVRHPDYTPAAGIDIALELRPADAVAQSVAGGANTTEDAAPMRVLHGTSNADGEAHLELAGLSPGAYRAVARATVAGRALAEEQTFVVRPEGRELEDVIARADVLKEIAVASGGNYREGSIGNPEVRKAREVRVGSLRTIEVWSHPALLLVALLFLATEWAVRRRAGHG